MRDFFRHLEETCPTPGVHVNCKSLNCESNKNCQCTIVYYEPKIQWNWIYDHTVNRGFVHV